MIAGIIAQVPAASAPPPVGDATTLSPNLLSPEITLSGSNLVATKNSTTDYCAVASIDAKISGKWYFEARVDAFGGGGALTSFQVGVSPSDFDFARVDSAIAGSAFIGYRSGAGRIFRDGDGTNGIAFDGAWSVNDVICVALDATARTVMFRRNNGSWSTAYSLAGAQPFMPIARLYGTAAQLTFNFGATSFAQSPPSGYIAWNKNSNYEGRYWRAQAYLGAGSGQSHAEVNFRSTVGGSNISRAGGTATASSTYPGYPASNAVDGNNSSFWSSNGQQDTAWWQFDFGSTQTVREVSITKRGSSDQAFRRGMILYSNDGSIWYPARFVRQDWANAQETRNFAVCDG